VGDKAHLKEEAWPQLATERDRRAQMTHEIHGLDGMPGQSLVGVVERGTSSLPAKDGRGRRFPSLVSAGLGLALVWGVAGCHQTASQSTAAPMDQNAGDPAVPYSHSPAPGWRQPDQYQAQEQAQDYTPQPQQAAPIEQAPYAGDPNANQGYDNSDQAADAYAADLTQEAASDPPPPLPEYDQPPAPDPNYIWTPGYWGWGTGGYYWVPGYWVAAPYTGALWTPGYWGFYGGRYRFHHGFWGLHIGFYGGIDYGFGYTGYGYYGGYWNHGNFFYNTAVNHVNGNVIRNVYVHNVVINNVVVNSRVVNRVSFNGGRGGVQAQPRPAEIAVLHEARSAPMAAQAQVAREASQNRGQFYSANKGRPAVAVNARPVVADRTPPAALPRVAGPVQQQAARGEVRPGQVQPQGQLRPGQVQPETRGLQQQPNQARPVPEARPVQPQPETRGLQPQRQAPPEQRQAQPQPQVRQVEPQQRVAPQPQARPAQPAPRPQEQARPAPVARPQPQERAAPAQAPRPQPQARPAAPPPHAEPQHEQPRPDEKPHQ
jgi:hypothetical protein